MGDPSFCASDRARRIWRNLSCPVLEERQNLVDPVDKLWNRMIGWSRPVCWLPRNGQLYRLRKACCSFRHSAILQTATIAFNDPSVLWF